MALGKLTVLSSTIAKDTPACTAVIVLAMQGVIADKGPHHMASFEAIMSIIGILIFMVMTLPHMLGIMNAPVS